MLSDIDNKHSGRCIFYLFMYIFMWYDETWTVNIQTYCQDRETSLTASVKQSQKPLLVCILIISPDGMHDNILLLGDAQENRFSLFCCSCCCFHDELDHTARLHGFVLPYLHMVYLLSDSYQMKA